MQVVEDAEVLPPVRLQRRLEQELECARLNYARLELWGEEYYSEERSDSEGYKGGGDGTSLVGTDSGGDGAAELVESRADVECVRSGFDLQQVAAITAISRVVATGDENGEDNDGVSVEADGGCGDVTGTVAGQRNSGPMWVALISMGDVQAEM